MTYVVMLVLLVVGQAASSSERQSLVDSPASASGGPSQQVGKRKERTTCGWLDWLPCVKRARQAENNRRSFAEKKLRVFFVRHGQVINPDGVFYGRHAWAPQEFGLKQSEASMLERDAAAETINHALLQIKERSGKDPRIVAVIHSPLKRTRESAEALTSKLEESGWTLPTMQICERVIEVNVPYWEGKKVASDRPPLKASVAGRRGFDWRCTPENERCRSEARGHPVGAPGGEMFTDMYQRVAGVAEDLWTMYAGSDAQGERVVIVVTHADLIIATKLFAHGRDLDPAHLTEDYLCNWRDAYCRGHRAGESERLGTNRDYHVNSHFHVSTLEYAWPTGEGAAAYASERGPRVKCNDPYLPYGAHPACWTEPIPTAGELDNRGADGQRPHFACPNPQRAI